jgi:hypothetical protein
MSASMFQATSINIKTGVTVQFPKRSYETINNVLSSDPIGGVVDGKPTCSSNFYAGEEAKSWQEGRFDLYRVDPDSGIAAMVQMGDFETNEISLQDRRHGRRAYAYHRENSRWSMELRKDGKWVDAYVTTAPLDGPAMLGLSLDEKSVVLSIRTRRPASIAWPMSRSPTASWANSTVPTSPSASSPTTPTTSSARSPTPATGNTISTNLDSPPPGR